jgi:hypothetical protein
MENNQNILVELSDKNTTRVTVQRNTTRVYRFHGEPTIQIDKESKCGVKLFRFGKKKKTVRHKCSMLTKTGHALAG